MQISLDDIPASDAIALYYEKHHALRQGDIEKLRALKNKCPELFNKIKDAEIRDLIVFAKAFQQTDRYKEFCRQAVKEKMTVINNDLFNK